VLAGVLAACTFGPDYRRPELPVPAEYRGATQAADMPSIGGEPWDNVLRDPVLQALVREAIAANPDLAIAVARVGEARARFGIARSYLLPELGADLGYSAQRSSRIGDPPLGPGADRSHENWSAAIAVSWELDVFGRLRRESEAAFATYLATEQGRRAAVVSLVGDVAATYLLLRQYDLQLQVSRDTLASNEATVAYYRKRLLGGLSNRLEVDAAIANRARTAVLIPQLEQRIALAENALSTLLGRLPGAIERGEPLLAMPSPPGVPAGLPAALLERRPDVLAAEQQLIAANADVGAAKARFFPSISLTGVLGALSADFADLLDDDAGLSEISPGLFAPVFQGGRLRRGHEVALAGYEQAFAAYRGAALGAYREVADALVSLQMLGAIRRELETGVSALQDGVTLARSRYEQGLSSYLEVLDADQQLLDQRMQLAATRGEEQRAVVELYRALGGGWEAGAPAP
jgi:multidrug efflux system outer membrane protein